MKLFTKITAVFAFFSTLLLTAAPIDYIRTDDAVGVANVNTADIINHPVMQQALPMIQEELNKNGFSIDDFEGTVSAGVFIKDAANKDIHITVAAEFKNPVAEKIFELILKESDDVKETSVGGKRAFKDDESRLIVMSPNMLLAQFAEGNNKAFDYPRAYKNDNPADLLQNAVFAAVDFSKLFTVFPMPEDEFVANFKKVKYLFVAVQILPGGTVKAEVHAECTSPDDAAYLLNLTNLFVHEFAKVVGNAELAKKVQTKVNGSGIELEVSFSNEEIQQFIVMAMSDGSQE